MVVQPYATTAEVGVWLRWLVQIGHRLVAADIQRTNDHRPAAGRLRRLAIDGELLFFRGAPGRWTHKQHFGAEDADPFGRFANAIADSSAVATLAPTSSRWPSAVIAGFIASSISALVAAAFCSIPIRSIAAPTGTSSTNRIPRSASTMTCWPASTANLPSNAPANVGTLNDRARITLCEVAAPWPRTSPQMPPLQRKELRGVDILGHHHGWPVQSHVRGLELMSRTTAPAARRETSCTSAARSRIYRLSAAFSQAVTSAPALATACPALWPASMHSSISFINNESRIIAKCALSTAASVAEAAPASLPWISVQTAAIARPTISRSIAGP